MAQKACLRPPGKRARHTFVPSLCPWVLALCLALAPIAPSSAQTTTALVAQPVSKWTVLQTKVVCLNDGAGRTLKRLHSNTSLVGCQGMAASKNSTRVSAKRIVDLSKTRRAFCKY